MRGRLGTAVWSWAAIASAQPREPWSDADPAAPPSRLGVGNHGFSGAAEYRAMGVALRPVDLSSTERPNASWIEHRLRLDGAADFRETVRIVVSADALDGGLWGDNGPSPRSGTRIAASNPSHSRPGVGLSGGDDALDPDAYRWVLLGGEPLELRRVYGEVLTPVGLVRVGRQPATEGLHLVVADGDGRASRWGVSRAGDTADRILFATKPLEALRRDGVRDASRERGLFWVAAYDRVVTNDVHLAGDDVHMAVTSLRLARPGRRLELASAEYAYRWEKAFDSRVHVGSLRTTARIGDVRLGAEAAAILGTTREISEALARINGDPATDQDVRAFGARAVARWETPRFAAHLEVDFATGDEDPSPGSTLSQFFFAEDANVGLLLFEHVLAFESARSAAVGTELLRRLGAESFPSERVDTEGSFTNAIAIFPQLDLRPRDDLLLRAGVLLAWAPDRVVDPIETLRNDDGATIEDDLVNFHGGRPGSFYGVELDGRAQWRFADHFAFDLEGAILLPGDALQDENGQAVRSVLVQGRTTFFL